MKKKNYRIVYYDCNNVEKLNASIKTLEQYQKVRGIASIGNIGSVTIYVGKSKLVIMEKRKNEENK